MSLCILNLKIPYYNTLYIHLCSKSINNIKEKIPEKNDSYMFISWSYRNQGFYLILLQTSTMTSVCLQKLDSCLIFYEIKLHFIYI
jgi:hypothetical protein